MVRRPIAVHLHLILVKACCSFQRTGPRGFRQGHGACQDPIDRKETGFQELDNSEEVSREGIARTANIQFLEQKGLGFVNDGCLVQPI